MTLIQEEHQRFQLDGLTLCAHPPPYQDTPFTVAYVINLFTPKTLALFWAIENEERPVLRPS